MQNVDTWHDATADFAALLTLNADAGEWCAAICMSQERQRARPLRP